MRVRPGIKALLHKLRSTDEDEAAYQKLLARIRWMILLPFIVIAAVLLLLSLR